MTSITIPKNGGAIQTTELEGIKLGVPAKEYHASEGVNHSSAKEMDISPRHYLQKVTSPPEEPSDAQVIGTITHSAVLESDFSGFVVKPKDMSFATKEGKAWRDSQSKPIITQEIASNIAGMVTSVKNHPMASRMLYQSKGNNEVSCWGRHKWSELLIKGRADRVAEDSDTKTVVIDLKTLERGYGAREAFRREILKWKYHSQAAWYVDLFGASTFCFVVVEKEAPFAVACYFLDPVSLKLGRELNDRRLAKIRECAETGKWPAYDDGLTEISIPDYALRQAIT